MQSKKVVNPVIILEGIETEIMIQQQNRLYFIKKKGRNNATEVIINKTKKPIIIHAYLVLLSFELFLYYKFTSRLTHFTNLGVGVHSALTGVVVNPLGVFILTAPPGSQGDCFVESAALFFGVSDPRGFVFLEQVIKRIRPFFDVYVLL